jgi:hypothetical protein
VLKNPTKFYIYLLESVSVTEEVTKFKCELLISCLYTKDPLMAVQNAGLVEIWKKLKQFGIIEKRKENKG